MWNTLQVYIDDICRTISSRSMIAARQGALAFESGGAATPTHTYRDDERLVERARDGDHGAFRQLFEHYAPLVYRVAYRMLGKEEDAADLTQEVFIRAYQHLASLKHGVAFQAWITRLAVNMAHDISRRRRPDTLSLDGAPPGSAEGGEWQLAAETPDYVTHVLTQELSLQVQQALLTLSPDHRIVVVLHHLEGMAVEDIARTIGVPAGTVKSRLARARAELKRKLAGYFEESG